MYYGILALSGEYGFSPFADELETFIEIADDEHLRLINDANKNNQVIRPGADGFPELCTVEMSIADDAQNWISHYQRLLDASDYKIIKAYEYFLKTGEPLREYDVAALSAERDNYRTKINYYRAILGEEKI